MLVFDDRIEKRIEKEKICPFWERFSQTLNKHIPAENKIRKNKKSEDFLLNTKQVYRKTSLENIEDKILGFQL